MTEQIVVPGVATPPAPEGVNSVLVSNYNELVILHVDHPQEYLPFPAVGAVDTATRMMAFAASADRVAAQMVIDSAKFLCDHVYDVRGDLKPAGGALKHELNERHRRTLTKRLEVVLNSQRERRKVSNVELAKQMVEICLKEIL